MSDERIPTSLKQHLSRDIKSFKELKGKKKLGFLWDYYKLPFLYLAVILIVVGVGAKMLWEGQKPYRLRICAVLNTENDCSPWFNDFTEKLTSDGQKGDVDLNQDQPFDYDNSYYYMQELEVMTTISSYRMDIAVCNQDMYTYLLALNACLPLDSALPSDLYQSLSDADRIDHNIANLQIDENGQIHEEEGIKGDFAVRLNGTSFTDRYNQPEDGSEEEPLYAVIISNTERIDDCCALIQELTKK